MMHRFLAIVLGGLSIPVASAQLLSAGSPSQASQLRSKAPLVKELPMPMTAPLFLESQTYTSTLYLVNQLNFGVRADVSAFDMSGALLTTGHFYLDANSSQTISIRKLLGDAGFYAEVGSLEAVSPENSTALLGQLSITRTGDSKAFLDEELFMPEKTTSSSLRAVIDSPQNSPIVSVTNVSPTDTLTLHLTCTPSSGSIVSKTVSLQSKQTKLVRACSSLGDVTFSPSAMDAQFISKPESSLGMAGQQVAGISITSDGPIGDVAAFGFVEHADTYGRYFSAMNFADVGLLNSTGTVFAGVPVGTSAPTAGDVYTPQVALTNFSDAPQTASIYLATSVTGVNNFKEIVQVALAAKSSQLVSLPLSKASPKWDNSFIVHSSGQPGDVLSKMMFKSVGSLPNVELIGKDELDIHNAGDHPWSLENGIGSTLYLFNHGNAIRKVSIRIGSGSNVWLKIYDLQPNETKSISIGDLIQRRILDDKGFAFPQEVTHGEVAWWAPTDGAPKVNGRVVQTDAQGTMARNFSCGSGVALTGILWSNYSGYFQVGYGQTIYITPQPQFSVINYPQYGTCPSGGQSTSQTEYLSWSWSANQNIAQIVDYTEASQTVHLQGVSQGSTTIQVNAYPGGNNGCTAVGNLQVVPPEVNITTDPGSDETILAGNTVQLTASGQPSGGTYNWTTSTSNVTLSNASSSTVTVNGASAGDALVTVTYTLNGISDTDDKTVHVQVPGGSSLVSDTGNQTYQCQTVSGAPSYVGVKRSTAYQLLDTSNNPIYIDGISMTESFTTLSDGCSLGGPPIPKNGPTYSQGKWGDYFVNCIDTCDPTSPDYAPNCQSTFSHTWSANGTQVFSSTVTYACQSITP